MFKNPFYYGNFNWGGKEYVGEHEPMITKTEFLKVQEFLSEKVKVSNNQKYYHPYTKIFTCAECGHYLTASKKKRNYKNGTTQTFTYYHCVKRVTNRCSQGSIEIKSLEEQILSKTGTLQLPKTITDYCLDLLHEELQREGEINQKIVNQRQGEIEKIEAKIETLFDMRLSGDINSEGYSKRKTDLENQKKELEDKIIILKESNNTDIYKDVKQGFNLQTEYQEAM